MDNQRSENPDFTNAQNVESRQGCLAGRIGKFRNYGLVSRTEESDETMNFIELQGPRRSIWVNPDNVLLVDGAWHKDAPARVLGRCQVVFINGAVLECTGDPKTVAEELSRKQGLRLPGMQFGEREN